MADTEVELLKWQNRRLKAALFTTTALLLIAIGVAGLAGIRAKRQAEKARAEAVRALQMAEVAREQIENGSEVEPQY